MSWPPSLADQVRSVATGDAGVRHTVEEHFRLIEEHTALNAFISLDRERALLQAEQCNTRLASAASAPPLLGATLGLKDIINQNGIAPTGGSSFYRELRAASTTARCAPPK